MVDLDEGDTRDSLESLNPAEAEAAVKKCTNKVYFCTQEYRRTGLELVEAKRALMIARTKAEFDPDCPRVERGLVTVGDREAWVARAVHDEAMAFYAGEINRENAIEALRSARTEQQGAMAINASVREAYRSAVADMSS